MKTVFVVQMENCEINFIMNLSDMNTIKIYLICSRTEYCRMQVYKGKILVDDGRENNSINGLIISYFLSDNAITIIMTFIYNLCASFKNLKLFYHKFSFSNTPFPPLRETLYACRLQLFAAASEFFKYAVFHFVVSKTASLEFIHQSARKMEYGGC